MEPRRINRYYKPLLVLGTLLYPIYALPWIFKSMAKNEYLGYILFSLSMGYSAYLMIPYFDFDLTRHYQDFEVMSSVDFDQIFTVDPRVKHYFFNIYLWSVNQLGLSKQFVPFSMTFMKYLLLFMVLRKVIKAYATEDTSNALSHKWIMIIFLVLIIGTVQYVRDVSGLRNNFAFVIFIYAIVKYYIDRTYILTFILLFFAILIHLSIIPLALIFYISNIFKYKKIARLLFVISILLLFSGTADNVFFGLIDLFKPFLKANGLYISYYMDPDGKWGAGYFADKSMTTLILEKYFRPLAFYFAALYLFIVKDLTFEKIKMFLYLTFIFIVMVSVSRTMLDRYSYFFKFLFIFVLVAEYTSSPLTQFKRYFLIILIAIVLTVKGVSIYRYGAVYIHSWKETLYVPAPLMMLRDIEPKMYVKEPYIK